MTHTNRGRLAVDVGGAWRIYWGNAPVPSGAEMLGTVTRSPGDVGALARLPTGLYAQGNASVLRGLDQRKVQAALDAAEPRRGGWRGVARTGADGASGVVRKSVTLDEASIAVLRELGDGDLSVGIRRAAGIVCDA